MKEFFDYLMRRKPLLLLFLAVFLVSGIFSYHIFIKSQAVIDDHSLDDHVALTNPTPPEAPSEPTPIETPVITENPMAPEETPEQPWTEPTSEAVEYVEAPGFFTIVQDARETALMEHPQVNSRDADTEVAAEIEVPHTGEAEDMPIGHGSNLEVEGAGEAQANPELAVPHTGETSKASYSILTTGIILLAVATIALGLYSIAAHFLR